MKAWNASIATGGVRLSEFPKARHCRYVTVGMNSCKRDIASGKQSRTQMRDSLEASRRTTVSRKGEYVNIEIVNLTGNWEAIKTGEYIGRGNSYKGLRASPLANRF